MSLIFLFILDFEICDYAYRILTFNILLIMKNKIRKRDRDPHIICSNNKGCEIRWVVDLNNKDEREKVGVGKKSNFLDPIRFCFDSIHLKSILLKIQFI